MKALALLTVTLALVAPGRADVSYKITRKFTGGALAQLNAFPKTPQVSSYYLKGQKMAVVNAFRTEIFDFDAHTITYIYKAARQYTVKNFSDLNAGTKSDVVEAKAEAGQTGQRKIMNGLDASELLLAVEMGPKLKLEISMWLSTAVPGSTELRDFYRRNAGNLPWAAIGRIDIGVPMVLPDALAAYVSCFDWSGCFGNPTMRTAVARLQSSIASRPGVPIEQVVRVTAPVGASWAAFMAGSPGAYSLAGPLIEMTMDASDFSTSDISSSVFAIPEGYKEGQPVLSLPPPSLQGLPGAGASPPILISRVDPNYPDKAKKGKQGTVVLQVVVDKEGRPRVLKVIRSLGPEFDEEAMQAVGK